MNFPETLDIKDFKDKVFKNNKRTTYSLNGIINHLDEVNFGYYYSFTKIYNKNEWYEFNDIEIKYVRY